jgi:hypothetical protein
VATLHPTHMAIGTPYDEEFYPFMKKWVDEARKNKLKVWFRGNVSGWEGWFDYPKMTSVEEHHLKIYEFIRNHPDLFADGDIFTPAPEPEQGLMGDPRKSEAIKQSYLQFLVVSYNNCERAMKEIDVQATCGYFSMNGDIAKDILDKKTVKQIGNVVTIDHYVKDPEKLRNDILFLHEKFDAPIVLGEFGAPIPDIHGDMDEQEQAEYMKLTMIQLLMAKNAIKGVNYWTAFDGTTSLFTTQFATKMAVFEIEKVFNPLAVSGAVKNIFHEPLSNISISTSPFLNTKTDERGNYHLLTIKDYPNLHISDTSYIPASINLSQKNMGLKQNIVLDNKNKTIWYYLRLYYQQITEKRI